MIRKDVPGALDFPLATCSVTMTAEACVRASFDRYFSCAMNVTSPGLGPLDARDAADLGLGIALQAAVQQIRKLFQLQNRTNLKSEI